MTKAERRAAQSLRRATGAVSRSTTEHGAARAARRLRSLALATAGVFAMTEDHDRAHTFAHLGADDYGW